MGFYKSTNEGFAQQGVGTVYVARNRYLQRLFVKIEVSERFV